MKSLTCMSHMMTNDWIQLKVKYHAPLPYWPDVGLFYQCKCCSRLMSGFIVLRYIYLPPIWNKIIKERFMGSEDETTTGAGVGGVGGGRQV